MNQTHFLEILVAENKEYFWHIKAKNGQIVATSGETFTTKQSCEESFLKVINAFKTDNLNISCIS